MKCFYDNRDPYKSKQKSARFRDNRIGIFIFLFWACAVRERLYSITIWAHPATCVAGPGFPLVSFVPAAKKDTASIPCAGESLRLSPFKNDIHAIFELWVLRSKTQEIVDAGIHAGRLSPGRRLAMG
jgi:hypothetical protein